MSGAETNGKLRIIVTENNAIKPDANDSGYGSFSSHGSFSSKMGSTYGPKKIPVPDRKYSIALAFDGIGPNEQCYTGDGPDQLGGKNFHKMLAPYAALADEKMDILQQAADEQGLDLQWTSSISTQHLRATQSKGARTAPIYRGVNDVEYKNLPETIAFIASALGEEVAEGDIIYPQDIKEHHQVVREHEELRQKVLQSDIGVCVGAYKVPLSPSGSGSGVFSPRQEEKWGALVYMDILRDKSVRGKDAVLLDAMQQRLREAGVEVEALKLVQDREASAGGYLPPAFMVQLKGQDGLEDQVGILADKLDGRPMDYPGGKLIGSVTPGQAEALRRRLERRGVEVQEGRDGKPFFQIRAFNEDDWHAVTHLRTENLKRGVKKELQPGKDAKVVEMLLQKEDAKEIMHSPEFPGKDMVRQPVDNDLRRVVLFMTEEAQEDLKRMQQEERSRAMEAPDNLTENINFSRLNDVKSNDRHGGN